MATLPELLLLWMAPFLLYTVPQDLENKACMAQMQLVLEGLGCPPKPGDAVQHDAKERVQALGLNPWPAPPA